MVAKKVSHFLGYDFEKTIKNLTEDSSGIWIPFPTLVCVSVGVCKNCISGVTFCEVKKLSLRATGRTDREIPAADHKFDFAYPKRLRLRPIHEPHFQAGTSQRRRCKNKRIFVQLCDKGELLLGQILSWIWKSPLRQRWEKTSFSAPIASLMSYRSMDPSNFVPPTHFQSIWKCCATLDSFSRTICDNVKNPWYF